MPVNRHELRSRAAHPHSAPRADSKRRRGLLGLDLNIPSLSNVVSGVTDGLGLTNSRPQQPAPAPAPSPTPSPPPQPTSPSQQPPTTQPSNNPQQPPANQPVTSQPPANEPPSSNPTSPNQQQPPPQFSSQGQANPSGSVSGAPNGATGTRSSGGSQPGETGVSSPGSGSESDSDSPNAGSSGGGGGGNASNPGNSFAVIPGGDRGTPVANVGGIPSQEGGSTIISRGPQGTRTLVVHGSSTRTVVGGSPTSNSDDPGNPDATPDGTSGASKPSSHLAIIVVVSIIAALFLLFLLFFLRRRYRKRKTEEKNQWWIARKRTSKDYQDDAAIISNNRKSARSSFGTMIDRSGDAFDVNFAQGLPALPPMAELRRTHNEFNTPLPTPSDDSHRRLSDGSIGSRSSRDNMSQFAFPLATAGGARDVRLSGGSLSAGLHLSNDPFSDPRPRSTGGTIEGTEEGFYTCSAHTGDLMSEVSCVSSSVHGTFNAEEAICRPYTSTMPDELTVTPGIKVKVVKVYDDGWAMVAKLDSSSSRGLIPLDCLRQPGQDFSTFLQEKRVDTYVGTANFRQL